MANTKLPKGFRRGSTDSIACPHRDVTCCEACARSNDEIVEAAGVHFWISDPAERSDLIEFVLDGPGVDARRASRYAHQKLRADLAAAGVSVAS